MCYADPAGSTGFTYTPAGQTATVTPTGQTTTGYTSTDQDSDEITAATGPAARTFVNGLAGVQAITRSGTATYYERDPSGQLVSQRTGTGAAAAIHCYVLDALGSVIALVPADGTTPAAHYTYDPYGAHQTVANPANPADLTVADANPSRYAAGYQDPATALVKYGTRYYLPTLGSWTQQDPMSHTIADPANGNPYAYVGGNPANYTDSAGRAFWNDWSDALDTVSDVAGVCIWNPRSDWVVGRGRFRFGGHRRGRNGMRDSGLQCSIP